MAGLQPDKEFAPLTNVGLTNLLSLLFIHIKEAFLVGIDRIALPLIIQIWDLWTAWEKGVYKSGEEERQLKWSQYLLDTM